MDWSSMFGVPRIIVTDGGTHFDNVLVKALQRRFKALYHITTAYAPWSNGIIERVLRELVRLFRTLLAECNMPTSQWPELVPLVEAVINRTPSRTRGGC